MQNKKDLANWKLQQLYILSSSLKKDKCGQKTFEKSFLDFKLKVLHDSKYFTQKKYNKSDLYIKSIVSKDLEMKTLLKLLYSLSFQDKIDHQQFTRSIFNILENLKLHSTTIHDRLLSENSPLNLDPYKDTVHINNLYYLYKIKNNTNKIK